jgi:hypothetical protein
MSLLKPFERYDRVANQYYPLKGANAGAMGFVWKRGAYVKPEVEAGIS